MLSMELSSWCMLEQTILLVNGFNKEIFYYKSILAQELTWMRVKLEGCVWIQGYRWVPH